MSFNQPQTQKSGGVRSSDPGISAANRSHPDGQSNDVNATFAKVPKDIPSLNEAIVNACVHFDQEFCQKVCRFVLECARASVAADEGHFEHNGWFALNKNRFKLKLCKKVTFTSVEYVYKISSVQYTHSKITGVRMVVGFFRLTLYFRSYVFLNLVCVFFLILFRTNTRNGTNFFDHCCAVKHWIMNGSVKCKHCRTLYTVKKLVQ